MNSINDYIVHVLMAIKGQIVKQFCKTFFYLWVFCIVQHVNGVDTHICKCANGYQGTDCETG